MLGCGFSANSTPSMARRYLERWPPEHPDEG